MANATIDHDEIRKWVESKGGAPAAVDRTHQGGDVGIIRIMFPDNPQSEHQSLVEISWDEFFEQFEESGLALLYDDKSLFSKIVGRDTLERREHGEHASRHHPDTRHHQKDDSRSGDSRSDHQERQAAGKGESRSEGHERNSGSQNGSRQDRQAAGKGESESRSEGRERNTSSEGGSRPDHQERQAAGKGESRSESQRGSATEDDDLKSREYKDADGNVHHHTRGYMEQHGKQ